MSPKIQVTAALLEDLESRIDADHPTVAAVIASLLAGPGGALTGDPLYSFTQSSAFRSCAKDSDRYLALLAKLHELHREEFAEFVAAQTLKRRYFGHSKEEVCDASRHNQAREIPGSRFWAIMNIDAPTKRRFLARLLVYIGYREEMVTHVRSLIGSR